MRVRIFEPRLQHAQSEVHFDVLLCVLFDIFDIYARWVVTDALSKRVVLLLEAREERLDACE